MAAGLGPAIAAALTETVTLAPPADDVRASRPDGAGADGLRPFAGDPEAAA
jgi:hypothetical protein